MSDKKMAHALHFVIFGKNVRNVCTLWTSKLKTESDWSLHVLLRYASIAYGHMKGSRTRGVYALALSEIAYGVVNVKPC